MRILLSTLSILLFQFGSLAQRPQISFKDVSTESGLDFSHISTAENRYLIESMSGGAAVFDCDGDGFLDVATINGSTVDNYSQKGGDPFIALYRQIETENSLTPRFENVTAIAGLARKGWGMAITAVDYDGDTIPDLFATGFNGNAVYRGKGGCRFYDVTEKSGLVGEGFQTGAAWADYDRDGDLDVFVAGYVSLDLENLPVFGSSESCSYRGIRVQCGPRGLPGERDHLYRNNGNGIFEEIGEKADVADGGKYFGLGVVWADYDNDGWLDLYVANDTTPNYLYRNNRDGTFSDVSFESGTSYDANGGEQASMGVTIEDYDWDGDLDIFVTNYEGEQNTLYQNLGKKGFIDISEQSKLARPAKPFVGWGTSFVDFDNDGWLDLLIVNGHVYPQIELVTKANEEGFRQHFLLQRNLGNGSFEDVTEASGLNELPLYSRRGAAFGDLNNDGLIDVVVTNLGEKPTVLLNATKNKNKKILFKLIEDGKNRDSIGARITVVTDKRSMIKEVQAGGSYLSQNDVRLHFGFGIDEKIESVEIRWPDGTTEKISGVQPDKIVSILKGKGVINLTDFR